MGMVDVRKRMGGTLIRSFFEGLTTVGRWHPRAREALATVDVTRNLVYGPNPEHRLDVWRKKGLEGPAPTVLLVHGGGFRILSKDTHWLIALLFARAGYTVFTINYRLAPRHPFPSALEDTCLAYRWVLDRAVEHGGDPNRLALAGESAGGNLITALTIAACFSRPEPYARSIFERGRVPDVILPACGMLQVTEPERFAGRNMPTLFRDRIQEVSRGYMGPAGTAPKAETALADPLTLLESDVVPKRLLPPAYLCVGTADPIEDDTHRLGAALARRGVPYELDTFEGELHAFHAFIWRKAAQDCWAAQLAFLARHLPDPAAVTNSSQKKTSVPLGSPTGLD